MDENVKELALAAVKGLPVANFSITDVEYALRRT